MPSFNSRPSSLLRVFASLVLLALPSRLFAHPCEAEVKAACPETPVAEVAACLKDPAQHETPTALSSECTDFVALNGACAEDIEQNCDEAFFSEDTTLCLTTWTDKDVLSERCKSVMSWAVPQDEEEDGDGPTDELGLSDEDYAEKKEWQEKRKVARDAAVARKMMKEIDSEKEAARVELEKFKREDPEGYAQMLQQQEETKRQATEMKRRERMQAAALERKKREESGEDAKEEEEAQQAKKKKKPKKQAPQGAANPVAKSSWLLGLGAFAFIIIVLALGYFKLKSVLEEGVPAKPTGKKSKKTR